MDVHQMNHEERENFHKIQKKAKSEKNELMAVAENHQMHIVRKNPSNSVDKVESIDLGMDGWVMDHLRHKME